MYMSVCVVLCRTVSYCVVLCRTVSYCVVRCRCCTTPCTTLYDASYIPDASGPDALYDTVRRVVRSRRVGPRRLVRRPDASYSAFPTALSTPSEPMPSLACHNCRLTAKLWQLAINRQWPTANRQATCRESTETTKGRPVSVMETLRCAHATRNHCHPVTKRSGARGHSWCTRHCVVAGHWGGGVNLPGGTWPILCEAVRRCACRMPNDGLKGKPENQLCNGGAFKVLNSPENGVSALHFPIFCHTVQA